MDSASNFGNTVERRRAPLGFIVSAIGGLVALLAFLFTPWFQIQLTLFGASLGISLTGMQIATYNGTVNDLLLVPAAAALAMVVAGIAALLRKPSILVGVGVPALAGLIGIGFFVRTFIGLAQADHSITPLTAGASGSNPTLSALSLTGAGFWITLFGFTCVLIGCVGAVLENAHDNNS